MAPVLPALTIARGPPVAHRLGSPDEGRVLLRPDALGRVVVHLDDLGGVKHLEVAGVAERAVGRTDEHDGNPELFDGAPGAGDDLAGGVVASHGVNRDRKRAHGSRRGASGCGRRLLGQLTSIA